MGVDGHRPRTTIEALESLGDPTTGVFANRVRLGADVVMNVALRIDPLQEQRFAQAKVPRRTVRK
jgi:hypothetical protein